MNKRLLVLLDIAGNLMIILGVGIGIFTYVPFFYDQAKFFFSGNQNNEYSLDEINKEIIVEKKDEPDSENILPYKPIDENFSIIIPKIDVNAPIVPNVSTLNEAEYMDALSEGVAHAVGTSMPGESGNMFLFAHSSLNFWQLGPYATVFNLISSLEDEDLVIVVRNEKSYVYKVFSHEIVPGWNTAPFEDEYDEPVLTMITCYPPGTTINRYVVKAKFVSAL